MKDKTKTKIKETVADLNRTAKGRVEVEVITLRKPGWSCTKAVFGWMNRKGNITM